MVLREVFKRNHWPQAKTKNSNNKKVSGKSFIDFSEARKIEMRASSFTLVEYKNVD